MKHAIHTSHKDALAHCAAIDAELYPVPGPVRLVNPGREDWRETGGKLPATQRWAVPEKHPTKNEWTIPIPPDSVLAPSKHEKHLKKSRVVDALPTDWTPTE